MLMIAPIAANNTTVNTPETKDPDRQAAQNPAKRRTLTPTYVEIAERAEKSWVGTNQSNAVRETAATPNSVPQTHEPDHLVFIMSLCRRFAFSLFPCILCSNREAFTNDISFQPRPGTDLHGRPHPCFGSAVWRGA